MCVCFFPLFSFLFLPSLGFLPQCLPFEARACSSVSLANQLPGNVWAFLEWMMNQLWNGMNN